MPQFLLAASENLTVPAGYALIPLDDGEIASAAKAIFPPTTEVVRIKPIESEIDAIADRARTEVLHGTPLATTELGKLLTNLADHTAFALFWASSFDDLPMAESLCELWQIIEPQLLDPTGNWEIYVRFG